MRYYDICVNIVIDKKKIGSLLSSKENVIELEGLITEVLPNASFKVKLDSGQDILGHLSGKMRINFIKILPGDRVLVEMSVYDLSKGRITRRLPIRKAGYQEEIVEEVKPIIADSDESSEIDDTHES